LSSARMMQLMEYFLLSEWHKKYQEKQSRSLIFALKPIVAVGFKM